MSQLPILPPTTSLADSGNFLPPQRADTSASQRDGVVGALRSIWGLLTMNRKVAVGSGIVGFFVLVAIFGPFLIQQNPSKFTLDLVQSPSAHHLLGTNQGGQDIFGQMVLGTRTTLFWTLLTGLLVSALSIVVGLVGGYFGGFIDDGLSLITNVFLVIPSFPLAIVAVEYFGRSTITIVIVVALTNWPWGARVLRAQTLSVRSREFVTAAKSSGERTWRIIFFEIFPNEISIVAANFVTTTIQVLLIIAGLEFLGFGDTSTVSWGIMLNSAYTQSALFQDAWWWFAPPGLCIALLGSGLALINFGIDEIADPRLRIERAPKLKRQKKAVA